MQLERWRQIEALYDAALQLDPSQRAAFLEQACVGDEDLRQEVASLLASEEQIGSFLGTPATEVMAKTMAAEMAPGLVGRRIGRYQVRSLLGAGGMGEIYLAEDTQLRRKVALKLLPVEATAQPERVRRFAQEARAASALNHPNIITIHEIGAVGSTHYIVTEFIDGQTLRQQPKSGRLGLDRALDVAAQIAAALIAAHEAGIVHRDIKPENVMIRPDGLVKVLDFGLAKLTTPPPELIDAEASTLAPELSTTPGVILGTLRYMSPEQVRAHDVDARSDIFSLGVVLYEMIAGAPPFTGETTADIIAAIINQEPAPLTEFTRGAPLANAKLERIVSKTLAKDRRSRYQTAKDLQIDLQSLKEDLYLSARSGRSGRRADRSGEQSRKSSFRSGAHSFLQSGWRRAVGIVIIAVLLIVGAVWLWPSSSPPPANARFETLYGRKGQDSIYLAQQSRFSPDGKMIAFAAPGDGDNIYFRQISGEREIQLTFDRWHDSSPIWSPDGERIAFIADRAQQIGVWAIPSLSGGTPELIKKLADSETIPTTERPRLAAWTDQGAAIYYEWEHQLFRLDLSSKQIKPVTQLDQSLRHVRDFALSPDGQEVAFSAELSGQFDIWRISLRGGQAQRVTNDAAPDLRAVWGPDGKLFYSSRRDGKIQLYLADPAGGVPAPVATGDRQCHLHDYSAASNRLLCYEYRDESDIFAVEIGSGVERQLTDDLGAEFWASVAPNGATLLYHAIRGERLNWDPWKSLLFTKPLRAKGQPLRLASEAFEAQWSPNGEQIGFLRLTGQTLNLWTINAAGGAEQLLTASSIRSNPYRNSPPFNTVYPKVWSWSPDGRQLAYCANQANQHGVWTASADGGRTTPVTAKLDRALRFDSPIWSPDGLRLAFVAEAANPAATAKQTRSLWVTNGETPEMIFQTESVLRFLGWSGNDRLLAAMADEFTVQPTTVKLLSLTFAEKGTPEKTGSLRTGQHWLGTLSETYWVNLHLSPHRQSVAFVKESDGRNDIWLAPISVVQDKRQENDVRLGTARKLTNNGDPSFFLASLAWSPDGKTIYYDKQTRWNLLTMIENF